MLKVIPIGGLNEIGKNLTLLEYQDEILIIDCGLSFPEDEMYGIDIVIPDFSYLIANRSKIVGMVITHGHEDHIGAIPYLLKHIKIPVYGTRLTLGLVENKLKEHGMKARMHTVKAGQTFKLGKHFSVEALRITHSIGRLTQAISLSSESILLSKRSARRTQSRTRSVWRLRLRQAWYSTPATSRSTIHRLTENRSTFRSWRRLVRRA